MRAVGRHPGRTRGPALSLVYLIVLASLLVGCQGGARQSSASTDSPSGGQATPRGPSSPAATASESPAVTAQLTPSPQATSTPTATVTPLPMDLLTHSTNYSCSFLPSGNLDGSDQLGVSFYFSLLYASVDQLDRLVVVQGTSDTGWSISYNSGVDNQAVSVAQFSVRQGDFGRSHAITIVVDADNHYPETDELNNTLQFVATLPATRPTTYVEDIPCS